MDKIINLELPEKCRIIAVSDVHTRYKLLKKLLEHCEYDPAEDYLIIAGDILERGYENIDTLRYVMELCKNYKAVCLLGNNDTMVTRMAKTYRYDRFAEKMQHKKENCFEEMARSLGFYNFSEEKFSEIRKAVREKFHDELDFAENLSHAVETEDFIFVHAGLENRPDWKNSDDTYVLTAFRYLREKNLSGKWVVCGHFPTYNFRRADNTVLPIIDNHKKIIDIDGGIGVKSCGQLNAFIINKNGREYSFDVKYEHEHPTAKILADVKNNMKHIYCDPYDYSYSIIDIKDGLAKVKIETTGEEGCIPSDFIYQKNDGNVQIWDSLSAFPDLSKGDIVRVCDNAGEYSKIVTEDCTVGFGKTKFLKMI